MSARPPPASAQQRAASLNASRRTRPVVVEDFVDEGQDDGLEEGEIPQPIPPHVLQAIRSSRRASAALRSAAAAGLPAPSAHYLPPPPSAHYPPPPPLDAAEDDESFVRRPPSASYRHFPTHPLTPPPPHKTYQPPPPRYTEEELLPPPPPRLPRALPPMYPSQAYSLYGRGGRRMHPEYDGHAPPHPYYFHQPRDYHQYPQKSWYLNREYEHSPLPPPHRWSA